MPIHKDVYVYSTDLIDLIMGGGSDYFDRETAALIDAELQTAYIDEDTNEPVLEIVDPECWYEVSWPEHVITPEEDVEHGGQSQTWRVTQSGYTVR